MCVGCVNPSFLFPRIHITFPLWPWFIVIVQNNRKYRKNILLFYIIHALSRHFPLKYVNELLSDIIWDNLGWIGVWELVPAGLQNTDPNFPCICPSKKFENTLLWILNFSPGWSLGILHKIHKSCLILEFGIAWGTI